MRLSLIAAVADNGIIGRGNDLPWRLPADLRRFKRLTMGHHLIVGRKTWQAIGRPLPGRTMLVMTRAAEPEAPGAQSGAQPGAQSGARSDAQPDISFCGSLDEALAIAAAAGDDEPFVAGGAEIYALALPRADRIYLTRVHAEPAGDARFPALDTGRWRLVSREERPADERNRHPLSFLVYEREPLPGGALPEGGLPEAGSEPSAARSSSRLK